MRGAGKGSLEICLLGPLELSRGSQPLRLGGAHARALLALLSLHRGTVVSVDRIVDGLWGESPPPTARHMVEVYVSKLRKLLGADVVATRPPGYLLAVDPESVDIACFERLLAEGRDALGEGDCMVAASRLANGLSLWRGPPLADFAYEPFAQTEIARLEELRLLAEEEWLEADLELGKGAELVAKIEELIAAAPFRERFRAQLMLALYRAGRQADALAAYRAARMTFSEELGVEPSKELRQLERAILGQEESLIGPGAPDRRTPEVRETRRVVTVAFVELAAGEAERDPEALRPVLTRSLERAEEVFQRYGAVVELVPDGTVMAVFGSPVAHEDDAVRSLHAVAELREIGVVSRAAVDTGEVLAGPEPVVRGPVVRAAAQLLASATPDDVLAGELTCRLAANSAQFDAAGLDRANAWRLVGVQRGTAPRPLLLETPVVGRRKELAELRKALARSVLERRPHLVTIVGEAGIGKSRLAREFASMAEPEARVLTGRCLAYGEGITYWPLREMIRELAPDETVQALNAVVARLADGERIARRLAAIVGLVEDVYPVEELRWAARCLFQQLASERPVILVFEDVHWAESSLLDLVQHVLDVGNGAPILLVCLARPEILEGHPDGLQPILTLEALSPSEAEELASRLDPAETLPSDHRAQVLATAEGNPLFLEQLVAFATEKRSQPFRPDVPPTLQALLAARLDLLGPGEMAVVESAAVVGREFWIGAVAELVPPGARTTLLRHLEALERKELLKPEGSALPFERAFRFRHVLIQQAAYRSLPKERRAELHERLAGWLEGTPAAGGGDQDEMVGYHLEQAYGCRTELGPADDRARVLALGAGEKLSAAAGHALGRNDLPAAVNLLTRATSLYEAGGKPRHDLLVDLGAALFQLGEGQKALAVLEAVLEASRATREPALEWRAKLERDYIVFHREPDVLSTEEGLRRAEHAIQALERLGDERALSRAWRSVTQCRLWLGKMESSLDASERALDYARRAGDRQGEIWTLRTRIMALWTGPTPAGEAARSCEEILATTENEEVVACALENLGGLRAMQGRFEEARRLVDSSAAIYEELGLPLRRAFSGMHRTEVHTLSGDLAAAEQDLRNAIELFESIGDKTTRSLATSWLAGTLYAVGRYSEAEQYVEMGEQFAGVDDYAANSKLRAVRAKILARRGEFERAKAAAHEAVRIADATDDFDSRGALWMDKAEVHELAGEPEDAASCLERAIELLEQKGNVVLAKRARAKLAEMREGAASSC
jgi:DNA-binding SARP family transcriptional activator